MRVSAEAIEMFTSQAEWDQPRVITPFEQMPGFFEAFQLPERRAANGRALHGWTFGTRLGPKATGKWSNIVNAEASCQPRGAPALRKVNWRELKAYLQSSNQIGMPCTAATDSQLGWSVYAFQSPEILFAHCDGAKDILVLIEGDVSKGYQAPKNAPEQRAKCGYCPCCSKVTHVLIPPTYPLGKD